jgi:uncharacterized protein (DUF736 family)
LASEVHLRVGVHLRHCSKSEASATQPSIRQRSEVTVDDIDDMLNGLALKPDSYIDFQSSFVNRGSDTSFVNGRGELLLPSGRLTDIVVKAKENRRSKQPSHRVYEVNGSNKARDIGILWWNQSKAGEWYFTIDIKDPANPFKTFLWPYEGSSTTWEIVDKTGTKCIEVGTGTQASP